MITFFFILYEANIHRSSGIYSSIGCERIQLLYILRKHNHSLYIIKYRNWTQCIPRLFGSIDHSDVSLAVSKIVPSNAISSPQISVHVCTGVSISTGTVPIISITIIRKKAATLSDTIQVYTALEISLPTKQTGPSVPGRDLLAR